MSDKIKSILIVDDDPSLQFVVAKRLRQRGFACHQALTVEDGLKQLSVIEPDLVILDLGFVGSDGTDFLQVMEQWTAPGKELPPVLVMSCFNSSDIVDYVLSHGARGFLAKPYDHGEFIERVNEFVG